jgi:hypothetical protein
MSSLPHDSEICIQGRAMRYLSARLRSLMRIKTERRLTQNECEELFALLGLARRSHMGEPE